jgi:hypothetical protein
VLASIYLWPGRTGRTTQNCIFQDL